MSKHYYTKYFQYSLIINDHESELKAYDHLGIMCMYLNKISLSKCFHDKAIRGLVEAKDSALRTKANTA